MRTRNAVVQLLEFLLRHSVDFTVKKGRFQPFNRRRFVTNERQSSFSIDMLNQIFMKTKTSVSNQKNYQCEITNTPMLPTLYDFTSLGYTAVVFAHIFRCHNHGRSRIIKLGESYVGIIHVDSTKGRSLPEAAQPSQSFERYLNQSTQCN